MLHCSGESGTSLGPQLRLEEWGADVPPDAVVVVLPTLGRPSELLVCLEALAAQTHPPWKVIVAGMPWVRNSPNNFAVRLTAGRLGRRTCPCGACWRGPAAHAGLGQVPSDADWILLMDAMSCLDRTMLSGY